MPKAEVIDLIEETLADLPERMSGNEANPLVAIKLRSLTITDRRGVIDALKSYLAFRVPPERRQSHDAVPEARIWMALDVAEKLSLIELQPEIESLVSDIRDRKVFLPIHENGVAKCLQRLSNSI